MTVRSCRQRMPFSKSRLSRVLTKTRRILQIMSDCEDDLRERTTRSNTKELVLVVDDDASIRRALSRLVKTWGYDVIDFADAESFLQAPLPKQTSCAILDLHLPALNGLEIQAELAKRGYSIPAVFLTGDGDIPTTVEAMRGGAVEFLQKPVRKTAGML